MHKEEAINSNLKLCVMYKLTYSRTDMCNQWPAMFFHVALEFCSVSCGRHQSEFSRSE